VWATQGIALGVEVPPEAWGGNVQTLADVQARAAYVKGRAGKNGMMLWSLHKQGSPSPQQVLSTVCSTLGLSSCSAPLGY
jgi:chitinase